MSAQQLASSVYVACVPHAPIITLQEEQKYASSDFWAAYQARVDEFDAFDPEVVIIFGGDHYSNVYLRMIPSFMIGHRASAIDDCGGLEGELDVPMDLSVALANHLVEEGFDIATSYAMKVDHGISAPLIFFLHHKLNGRPVIPVYINAIADPRPTMKRTRLLGQAIGEWAATLGKRVAFLGTGGLSHGTGGYFPQFKEAKTEELRTFIVHGGTNDGITDEKWHSDMSVAMEAVSQKLVDGARFNMVNPEWDRLFLKTLEGDIKAFDSWTQAEILAGGDDGGCEVRMWVAAVAAGQAAGAGPVQVDYYSDDTSFGIGAGIVHIEPHEPAENELA